jgi:hypothetical protein
VLLALNPVTEHKRYKHEAALHGSNGSVRIKVEVNQRDYNAGGDTMRYRCVFPDGQILWVPLDALNDEYGAFIKDEYFDDPPRPWEAQAPQV